MTSHANLRVIAFLVPLVLVSGAIPQQPELRAQDEEAAGEFDKFLEGLDSPSETPSPRRPPDAGEDLGASQPSNPLADLAERMRDAGRRLADQDTSEKTQDLQTEIGGELEALIKRLESQAAQRKAAQRSATRPSNQAGTASASDPSATSAMAEDESQETLVETMWGKLPQRLRQQIQSPLHEEFLPSYQGVIEAYYKRVAERQKRLRNGSE